MYSEEDFTTYTRDISRLYRKIPVKEERAIGKRILGGDTEAVNELVVANLPLVIHTASKFKVFGITIADLIQEGNIGLMRAAQTFNYKKNVRFSTHAMYAITGRIRRAIENKSRLVKLPSNVYFINKRIKKAYYESKETGKKFKTTVPNKMTSMGEYHPDNYEFKNIPIDTVYQICATNDAAINNIENIDEIENLMSVLSYKEKEIVVRYCGLYNRPNQTFKEIEGSLKLSDSSVRKNWSRALLKLWEAAGETKQRLTKPKLGFPRTRTPQRVG